MAVTDLAEFLLARIAEDEEEARGQIELREARYPGEAVQPGVGPYQLGGGWWLQVEPRHVLAECEAKRRIVDAWVAADRAAGPYPGTMAGIEQGLEVAVACLALPYADHPDYDQAWRP